MDDKDDFQNPQKTASWRSMAIISVMMLSCGYPLADCVRFPSHAHTPVLSGDKMAHMDNAVRCVLTILAVFPLINRSRC